MFVRDLALGLFSRLAPSMRVKKLIEFYVAQNGLFGLHLAQLEGPRHTNPRLVSLNFGVGRIPFFSLLALWGNKIGLPIMKVKKFEKFKHKLGLGGCIWSSLMAQGIKTHLSHPILELEEFPFLIIGPLG